MLEAAREVLEATGGTIVSNAAVHIIDKSLACDRRPRGGGYLTARVVFDDVYNRDTVIGD